MGDRSLARGAGVPGRWLVLGAVWMAVGAGGCSRSDPPGADRGAVGASPGNDIAEPDTPPRLLHLPDARPSTPASALEALPAPPLALPGRCPPEMVDVGGRFCIDRYEAVLVDAEQGRRLSPYYHPTRGQTRASWKRWQRRRLETGSAEARAMPLPEPPAFQLEEAFEPRAAVERGAVPSGYLSRDLAEVACRNAGKRLCTAEEWATACRGQQDRKYPYGDEYVAERCNVFRPAHPAALLHGSPSIGHLDPRLNQVSSGDAPLLRRTGETSGCRSEWGGDAVYDMVGNLDEWVDDPKGVFLGGFYSRGTREGCDARIEVHPPGYFDYSLGVRCCKASL